MKALFTSLFLLLNIPAYCQSINYDKIIVPLSSSAEIDLRERLVQLAWNNHPVNSIAKRNVEIAAYDLKLSRRQWFDVVNGQGNMNEFNIDPSSDVTERAQFYPRYNLSARISLGMFFTIPISNKKYREGVAIALDEVNSIKLQVRENVLSAYNTYIMHEKIYGIVTQALNDAESAHGLTEEVFKRGEETYENYIKSLSIYNNAQIEKIKAERDYLNSKVALEALIGVPLEEVN